VTARADNTQGGYGTRAYAEALCLGEVLELPGAGGCLIARHVPGDAAAEDLMGPYPLFVCKDWSRMPEDLDRLPKSYATATLVTDPFSPLGPRELEDLGWDHFARLKEHYVVDLTRQPGIKLSRHHRRKVRAATRQVDVQYLDRPLLVLEDWLALYQNLVRRHAITGIARFSRESFERQLALPGMVAMVARGRNEPLGITLWLLGEDVAYYHLGAYSETGYAQGASFALFAAALQEFHGKVTHLALGGAAGVNPRESDGLARFKAGWATGVRDVYLCGRVLNGNLFQRLCDARPRSRTGSDFFPPYRA